MIPVTAGIPMITKKQIIELLEIYPEEHLNELFGNSMMETLRLNYDLLLAVREALKNDNK